jgi:hypothetical protein
MVSPKSKLEHLPMFEFARGGMYDDILDDDVGAFDGKRLSSAARAAREDHEQERLLTYARYVNGGWGPAWMNLYRSRGNSRALGELGKVMHQLRQTSAAKPLRYEAICLSNKIDYDNR